MSKYITDEIKNDFRSHLNGNIDWDQLLNEMCFQMIKQASEENLVNSELLADSMINGIRKYLLENKWCKRQMNEFFKREYGYDI